MKFHVSKTLPSKSDALIARVIGGQTVASSGTTWLAPEDRKAITAEVKRRKFKAGAGQTFLLPSHGNKKYRWILVLGIGNAYDTENFRKTTAAVISVARAHHLYRIVDEAPGDKVNAEEAAAANVEGALLADYRFDKHQSGKPRPEITLTTVAPGPKAKKAAVIAKGQKRGRVTAEAQILARDLANEPPSHLTPKQLAAEARKVARQSGLGISVLGPAQLQRLGFGATLAVAKGSDEPPQLIKLTYRPKNAKKHIVLVGKSITYDSGGLNIKPTRGGSMELMKLDMSGGAAVLGAMSALKRLGVKCRVTGYLPATENLLGGSAYKPGDVVKTYNGKTIEVGNTDAEGRLTLADALAYTAAKDKPDVIIDLATLTETEISLGPSYAAVFATKPQLETQLRDAGERSGEKLWPLPFPEEYDEMTKSPVADFSNIVAGRAYTLSGPLLLKHFVGKTPWAHLDIGGPAMAEKDSGYTKKGGSGFGTRLLLDYLANA